MGNLGSQTYSVLSPDLAIFAVSSDATVGSDCSVIKILNLDLMYQVQVNELVL